MESFFSRNRNLTILATILIAQVLGLAVQVRRGADSESTRLIRVWAVGAVTPFEKGIVWAQASVANLWHNYFYLRGVRQENRDLHYEIQRLQLEQVRLSQDAAQARRLQSLLGFKEQFISKTLAAQVIGFDGSELSRAVYIDKGSSDGLSRDMAVITADGVVGKILRVYSSASLVLLINDQTSGVGVFLENSRLQGVLRGTPAGGVVLEKILGDETVQPGERVLTSGGDRIFPKGLAAGTVVAVSRGGDSFLDIRVHPAANLGKLEEVLVITQDEAKKPVTDQSASSMRAVDILAQRLPSVPDTPPGSGPPTDDGESPAKPSSQSTRGSSSAAVNSTGSGGTIPSAAQSSATASSANSKNAPVKTLTQPKPQSDSAPPSPPQ